MDVPEPTLLDALASTGVGRAAGIVVGVGVLELGPDRFLDGVPDAALL
eukprot:CAMPEP_0198115236 /NCGR_PEP_ID=MMETSP1442-20131203/6407_1 /TAXON_ID= /ORGANISM="Craspedostauros australis, Strain CCMP3328" /LENGTH=47 /DNA_ID= /DNA_START= /DNA_END= /DNA_ORIENTATION=